jgi:hypothetical protein
MSRVGILGAVVATIAVSASSASASDPLRPLVRITAAIVGTGEARPADATAKDQQPPPKPHTGLSALALETGKDFMAFPRRQSTWVILAIGGGAAALALPVDDSVNAHLTGPNAGKFFAPGKYLG